MYYKIPLDEELHQVTRAVDYYLNWAEEFRTTVYDWDFFYEYYRGLRDPEKVAAIRFRALFFAMRLQPVLSYIEQFVRQNNCPPRLLDLGSGMGLESLLLSLTGAVVHGIDAWTNMIDFAKYRQAQYQARHDIQLCLSYEHSNVFKFDPPEPYDAVYSSAVLHHIEPAGKALEAISHLIKSGGYFFS